MMNTTVKQLWLDALRSGQYEQGEGRLRQDNNFCCLGVLCDIFQKTTGKGAWVASMIIGEHIGDYVFEDGGDGEPNANVLPMEVQLWSGLPDANPTVGELSNSENSSLAEANDHGHDFNEIAGFIQRNF